MDAVPQFIRKKKGKFNVPPSKSICFVFRVLVSVIGGIM